MIADRQAEPMEQELEDYPVEEQGPRRPPRGAGLLAIGISVVVLALGLLIVHLLTQGPTAADVGRQEAKALVTQDLNTRWDLAPSKCQSYVPRDTWIATERGSGTSVPADTNYDVVSDTTAGVYHRVDVRVTVPGRTPTDIEVDVKRDGSRWAVADWGLPGHQIEELCKF